MEDNTTNAGWTDVIVLNVGGIKIGYQNFSGYWGEFLSKKRRIVYSRK